MLSSVLPATSTIGRTARRMAGERHEEEDAMSPTQKLRAIFTDSHFLVPLIVFCIGLALLITLH